MTLLLGLGQTATHSSYDSKCVSGVLMSPFLIPLSLCVFLSVVGYVGDGDIDRNHTRCDVSYFWYKTLTDTARPNDIELHVENQIWMDGYVQQQ